MSDKYSTHYLLSRIETSCWPWWGSNSYRVYRKVKLQNQPKEFTASELSVVQILGFFSRQHDTCSLLFQFQFCIPQPRITFFFVFRFQSTHLAVLVAHGEQSNGAVGVAAAVANGGHVPVPHDWHGGKRLARGVRVRDGVALPARRGQLWAECEVLLHLLVLGLVEMELRVLQVTLDLQQKTEASVSL